MSGVPADRRTFIPPQKPARTLDERIDLPETAEDYLLAAQAWAGGRRSAWNQLCGSGPDRGADTAACAVHDSARAQAYAAVAVAMAALR